MIAHVFLSLNHCLPKKNKAKTKQSNVLIIDVNSVSQIYAVVPFVLGSAANDSVCAMFSLTLKTFSYATKKRCKQTEVEGFFFCGLIISLILIPQLNQVSHLLNTHHVYTAFPASCLRN